VLFDLVRATDPDVEEGVFVDNVTRHLRRGEFLLPIIGDGIREGVENIVDFVQQHSGLHFNLALVEAALYRDKDDHVIVQPRVLCRTEIVRRVVFEAGETRDILPDDAEREDVLSDLQREHLRFWTAVLANYAFSDVTVDVPDTTKESALYVMVDELDVLCRQFIIDGGTETEPYRYPGSGDSPSMPLVHNLAVRLKFDQTEKAEV